MDAQQPKLTCGLEVHQQLDTGKLFCRCPGRLTERKPDFLVKRKIRAVASELGEYDAAALEAMQKEYSYVYEGFDDLSCLVELDEEPPRRMDEDALETTLKVCALAKAGVFPRVVVMRKTVVDGSNTSGFQRTALFSLGGELKTENGKTIGIQAIALEEDACRPSKKDDETKQIFYRLDRLGVPLIELSTEPCIRTPKEAKEAALAIGELFRITCKAKRGLGTIRQDLNISIEGGARVEIKGCQELELIDEYVRREVQRQESLIRIMAELKKRKASGKEIKETKPVDVSGLFKNSECELAKGKEAFATKIPGFSGILGTETQPGKRFGSELSAYVKAKASLKGLFHSDELPAYGISEKEKEEIAKAVGAKKEDAFAMVVCGKEQAEKAFKAIAERCIAALKEVPKETRNALKDGNTEYSRPLPGAARMYPETDISPVEITREMLSEAKKTLPLNRKQRLELYEKKFGLSKQLAEKMSLNNHACLFERLVQEKKFNATTTAVVLLEKLTGLKRKKGMTEDEFYAKATNEIVEEALEKLFNGEITRENFLEYVDARAFEGKKETRAGGAGEDEVRKEIKKIVKKNTQFIKEKGERAPKALMGEAMKQLKGKANGAMIAKLLEEEIRKAT